MSGHPNPRGVLCHRPRSQRVFEHWRGLIYLEVTQLREGSRWGEPSSAEPQRE